MTYNPQYNRPVQGNFDPDNAFSQVRAGTGAYWLEDEANEMQAILREQNRDTVRRLLSSGVMQPLTTKVDTARTNTLKIAPFEVVLDGLTIKVKGVNTTGTARTGPDGEDNLIKLGAKPTRGSRTDLIILEVFEEEVQSGQVLYKHGAQNSDYKVANNLLDERISAETARRVQVKSVLRVIEDEWNGWKNDLNGSPYTELSPGVFRSAAGRLMLKLLSVARRSDETGLSSIFGTTPRATLISQMIPSSSITSDKLASASVTYDKLALDTKDTLHPYENLKVPFGAWSEGGFVPILRFFQWFTMSSPVNENVSYGSAKNWGENLQNRTSPCWTTFEGFKYMPSRAEHFRDSNQQMMTYNGPYYSENVSLICLQNKSSLTRTCKLGIYYSSNAVENKNAAASFATAIIDPNIKPQLSGRFVGNWEATATESKIDNNISFEVPAGHVIIFILKTSPQFFANNAHDCYWYHNYHGITYSHDDTTTYFKPHLGTYHRLLTGVWS
ncbi:hypothetical protein CIG75_03175 [Tumebacillus algifaecis]|uniref:Uncharacterized protein n=1 Tax=Tumebacillus algifaecis TaxID=1214604 RepID=A0A223CY54_9BACL|nr:hypothetical protein [Tumebacillus algifaecis]ASS74084.1 hypothetical protein CIG75_03175 [Tumebacillus algifaecis]